jgi:hypothetical protein
MTAAQKIQYKARLLKTCAGIIRQRIAVSALAIENAQVAANEEEKSSAGDKYETSRAMSHLEKDMYGRQLEANKAELAALLAVDGNQLYKAAVAGAVIKCEGFSFLIAAGLGKILFEETIIYLLSPNAPVANILNQKKRGDRFLFNGKDMLIVDIF